MPKQFEILDEENRLIAGWASVEIVDSHGDIIPIQELERGMLTLMDRGGHILYGHSNKPVGKILAWQIKKHDEVDANGLWIVAKIFKEYPLDNEVWRLIKEGALRGFSIGAQGRKEKMMLKDANNTNLPREINLVRDLNLLEISIVPTPANPLATIEEINFIAKSADSEEKNFMNLEEVLRKYKIRKELFDMTEGCGLCLEIASIIKDVGDIDLGVRIWRAIQLERQMKIAESLEKVADEVSQEIQQLKKSIVEDLREYEDDVTEYRAAELESATYPEDPFYTELMEKIAELKKTVDILKPFGKWENFDECVKDMKERGYDEESAKRVCGSLQAKLEKELEKIIDIINSGAEFFDILENLRKHVSDIFKDKRPPKEWFYRCVDRTGSPALCGWVFYHHLQPTKPKSKRGPDKPHTRSARSRKRAWLRAQ